MNSNSASSASKAASSAMTSGASSAASAASKASASIASSSAKASNYANNLANDVPTKSAGIFSLSTLTLTVLAIVVGAAYYNGYLDALAPYIQQLLGQANDQKERIMKENTGTTSIRSAAQDKLNQGTARANEMVDQVSARAQQQQQQQPQGGRVQGQTTQRDGPATLLSDSAH